MPLLTQAFQNYRKKQAGKSDQKWPEVLEGPFLDGEPVLANTPRPHRGLCHG
jgi:hypothetical protein